MDGVVKTAADERGDGPVDATFNAIHAIFPHTANLHAVLGRRGDRGHRRPGQDAPCGWRRTARCVDGQGADTDTIVASARAYVHALNKLITKRARTAPEALSA